MNPSAAPNAELPIERAGDYASVLRYNVGRGNAAVILNDLAANDRNLTWDDRGQLVVGDTGMGDTIKLADTGETLEVQIRHSLSQSPSAVTLATAKKLHTAISAWL